MNDRDRTKAELLHELDLLRKQQKTAELLLRESEEKFRTIFDTANDGILILNHATMKFVEANKTICAKLGYTREEIMQMGVRDIHPEKDLPSVLQELEKQLKGEKIIAEDLPVKRKDGSIFFADISATVMQMGGEKHSVGIFRDSTLRKQAEEALKNSERFIRTILDTVDEGFLVIDRGYRILSANKAYGRQANMSFSDMVGRHCYEVSHKADQPCHEKGEECPLRHVFDTGEPHGAVHRHGDLQGNLLYVETKAYPMKDASGSVVSVIETINNITEKYLLEEERLKTQKLEAIGTLAGGIAHDFNNLLQGVFGYISMAKITINEKERSLAMLGEAEQALHLSVNLTKQLLTFSKGGKPVKKIIPVRPVIENAVKFALSGSCVDYKISAEEQLRMIEADGGQIEQVIQNIVINAEQAMPLGGTVVITAKNGPDPGKPGTRTFVEITIQDTGIGISGQYLSRIFDPYFTTREKGSGLGLATAYSIVRSHGGIIEVVSEVDKGTTVSVYLPAVEAEIDVPDPPVLRSVKKGRILVMDDEELIRNIAGEMITAAGHEVESAAHGEAAVEKYKAARAAGKPFDIVILDLTVRGGVGGKQTIQKLLEIDPGVRAIVSSGYSDDAVVSDFSSFGFAARLTKPYDFEELTTTLNSLLSKKK